jgi:replication factor A2
MHENIRLFIPDSDQKYVRVFGGLKSFGKKRYLNINHIRLVSDPHEVYFHILEAITVSLIVERGPVRTFRIL